MDCTWCWGRECKLGWGYNQDLDKLVPVTGIPPNISPCVTNDTFDHISDLSSNDIYECVRFLSAN